LSGLYQELWLALKDYHLATRRDQKMIKPESAVRSTFCGAAKIVRCETSSLRHRRNFACMQIEASGASVSAMLQGGAWRAFVAPGYFMSAVVDFLPTLNEPGVIN
jgi:hypothetical protein